MNGFASWANSLRPYGVASIGAAGGFGRLTARARRRAAGCG